MKTYLLSILGILVMWSGTLTAAEAGGKPELLPREALRLISMRTEIAPTTIEISFIVEGSGKLDEGFQAKHVRRVAAIHGVRNGVLQPRRLLFYDFFWNDSLGWFMWETRFERTGEAVFIWSEVRGEIVNR